MVKLIVHDAHNLRQQIKNENQITYGLPTEIQNRAIHVACVYVLPRVMSVVEQAFARPIIIFNLLIIWFSI